MRGGKLRMLNVIGRIHARVPMYPRGPSDKRSQGEVGHVRVDRASRSARPRSQRQRFGLHRERVSPRVCREADQDPLSTEPGSPWQNGYVETLNAHFREECLVTCEEAGQISEHAGGGYGSAWATRNLFTPSQCMKASNQRLLVRSGLPRPKPWPPFW
jgi:hypothetical protein